MSASYLPVILAPRAEREIEGIFAYLVRNQSETRARKVLASIEGALEKIARRPYQHVVEPTRMPSDESIRRTVVGRTYIIVYHIQADRIVVLSVFHCAQDPAKLKD